MAEDWDEWLFAAGIWTTRRQVERERERKETPPLDDGDGWDCGDGADSDDDEDDG